MAYVAAVFSMKPRWLRRHAGNNRLRVRVLTKQTFDSIADGGDIHEFLPKKYRRWVNEESFEICASELDAWEAAIRIRDRLLSQRRPVDLKFTKGVYRLYVFQMDATVLENNVFANMNPNLPTDPENTCVYVGKTSASLNDRYNQHRSESHRARTNWGRQYFLVPYEQAFRQDLLDRYTQTDQQIEARTNYEALKGELSLRKWLQEQGIAAYSN